MSSYTTRAEVLAKIDHEGGMEGVLEYGLGVDDLPEDDIELRDAWRVMIQVWDAYTSKAEIVEALLDGVEDDEDDQEIIS